MLKGYKAFDSDLSCKGYQFEIGKTHKHDGQIELCKSGFHFCRYPIDVLDYYPIKGSRFARVEVPRGAIVLDDYKKSVTNELTVTEEISIETIYDEMPEYILRQNGSHEWYKDCLRHREGDEPAIIKANGTRIWMRYGTLYRDDDKPPIVEADGTEFWYYWDHISSKFL
jgi:hypothetical protein